MVPPESANESRLSAMFGQRGGENTLCRDSIFSLGAMYKADSPSNSAGAKRTTYTGRLLLICSPAKPVGGPFKPHSNVLVELSRGDYIGRPFYLELSPSQAPYEAGYNKEGV